MPLQGERWVVISPDSGFHQILLAASRRQSRVTSAREDFGLEVVKRR